MFLCDKKFQIGTCLAHSQTKRDGKCLFEYVCFQSLFSQHHSQEQILNIFNANLHLIYFKFEFEFNSIQSNLWIWTQFN